MLDALKTLFENDVVSAEVRQEIEEAWDSKVRENRQQVTAELREEFAQKYEHDKATMVEAIDQLVSERLQSEIEEFTEDRKQLAEAKAKYAIAMKENSELLKSFVFEQLKAEVNELHEDQKAMAENFSKLEEFVVEALAKEIAEFYEDKKDLAETKVKLVKEAKAKFADIKSAFVSRSAKLVSETVSKTLNKEISSLKEDIDQARQNDFGRRLFEAFASEYSSSLLNEKSELQKIMKVVDLKDKQIAEAKAEVEAKTKLLESKEKEARMLAEATERNNVMHELLSPLSKDQREVMNELLESVQTTKLRSAYDKYLPTVIAEGRSTQAKKKAIITEGTEVTGNKTIDSKTSALDDNVVDIRRLAGL